MARKKYLGIGRRQRVPRIITHWVGLGMIKSLFAAAFLGLSITAAGAIDMKDLAPCRPAAAKLCDRTGGLTMANLMRCGATLAANSWRVGNSCRVVLRRYGQL